MTDDNNGEVTPSAHKLAYVIKNRRLWLMVAALAVIFVATALVVRHTKTKNGTVSVCSNSLIGSASKAIDTGDKNSLDKYQSQILQKKNYAKDANCLYILMRTAMVNKDASGSRKYLTALQKISTSQVSANTTSSSSSYSTAFTTRTYDLNESNQIVSYMEQKEKDDAKQQATNQERLNQLDQDADKQLQGQQP